eukprot:TRINITY_DN54958_c0_g1_i1.p1 TRINITY_DN54958_c0_g1~~TRINITY_DN54958_c0_g1_i1.p1  ORF type:complete len:438 (-),score=86.34 TRINITY_DN54958_c0_g1_i1:199-1455(-)
MAVAAAPRACRSCLRMIFALHFLGLALALGQGSGERATMPEFKISLDEAPEERFREVLHHYNASLHSFVNGYLGGVLKAPLRALLAGLVAKRGAENAELQGEIRGMAQLTGIPEYEVHAMQMLYELQTLMVPIDNISWPHFGVVTDIPVKNVTLPWRGPGCTGILAINKANGKVYHARNLDFSPKEWMQSAQFVAIFTRGGKEVFRAQMIAGYFNIVTGMKMGSNGFSLETNTRYPVDDGRNTGMLRNLLQEKRPFNNWVLRKVLETAPDYEAAVEALSTTKVVATQFVVIGGVKKGTILARSPDSLEYQMTLGRSNYGCRDDYILVTNFDFYWHDIKENFDPTARGGHKLPRRIAAQKLLNATEVISPETLSSVINDRMVLATDTVFQAIMSVEDGLWNVSLPPLDDEHFEQSVVVI